MDWDRKWLVDFHPGKTQFVSIDCSNSDDAIDLKMDWCVLAIFEYGLRIARFWDTLPAEWFYLTYLLNGLRSKVWC